MPLAFKQERFEMQILNKSQKTYVINQIQIKPSSIVELTKAEAEKLVKAYPNDFVVVQAINLFEENDVEETKPKAKKKAK